MRAYLEFIRTDLLLALRNRSVLFFNYLFPLIFFFAFAEFLEAGRGEDPGTGIIYVVNMVLLLGILGNGLFGAGMRTVQERENNILRRFKVAPISATPILVASLVTGLVLYLPALVLVLTLARFFYGMKLPQHSASLILLVSVGVLAFRALGLILAAAANSMQEVNILVQLFYSPLLFLSGALFPLSLLPHWLQVAAQFLPATYLAGGLEGILLEGESILDNGPAVLSLLLTVVLSLFISVQVFRWEKEEKVSIRAKLWILAVLAPFVLMGACHMLSARPAQEKPALFPVERVEPLQEGPF